MQYAMLQLFQAIKSPFLDLVMNALSFFGELPIFFLLIMAIYYGLSKKMALELSLSIIMASAFSNAMKWVFRFPRPFMVHPELDSGRLHTATGYSFPSVHTTGAASFYPLLGSFSSKRKYFILGLTLAALIGLSRNYFAVHWPMDVAAGFIIGLLAALVAPKIANRIYGKGKATLALSMAASLIALLEAIGLTFLSWDPVAHKDLMLSLVFLSAVPLSVYLEERYVGFEPRRSLKCFLLNFLIGIIGAVAFIYLLGLPFANTSLYWLMRMPRYGLAVLWALFIWPYFSKKLGLFG